MSDRVPPVKFSVSLISTVPSHSKCSSNLFLKQNRD